MTSESEQRDVRVAASILAADFSQLGRDIKFLGENNEDGLGISVSGAGDVNGDGLDDIIIGAWNGGEDFSGATYLLL